MCHIYSTFRNQYIFSQVFTLNSDLRTFVIIDRPCWTTQPIHSKGLKMKPLNRGFQWCIDFVLSMSIRVVVDIYCFGGYFWCTPQNIVLIPTVDVDSRIPWCPTQATPPKWLKMKPLNRGFQWCSFPWTPHCLGTHLHQHPPQLAGTAIVVATNQLLHRPPFSALRAITCWLSSAPHPFFGVFFFAPTIICHGSCYRPHCSCCRLVFCEPG